jgi:hypothetical protein
VLDNAIPPRAPWSTKDATAALDIGDPVEAVARIMSDAAPGDLTIVAGSIDPSAVMAIQRASPGVSVIVTDAYFNFDEDTRIRFERPIHFSTFGMLGGTLVVVLQGDSAAIIRLGLTRDARGMINGAELEDIVLDETVPDDPAVRARLDAHYARMAAESGLAEVAPIGPVAREARRRVRGAGLCLLPRSRVRTVSTIEHAAAFATRLSGAGRGAGCFACHAGHRQPGATISDHQALRHVHMQPATGRAAGIEIHGQEASSESRPPRSAGSAIPRSTRT